MSGMGEWLWWVLGALRAHWAGWQTKGPQRKGAWRRGRAAGAKRPKPWHARPHTPAATAQASKATAPGSTTARRVACPARRGGPRESRWCVGVPVPGQTSCCWYGEEALALRAEQLEKGPALASHHQAPPGLVHTATKAFHVHGRGDQRKVEGESTRPQMPHAPCDEGGEAPSPQPATFCARHPNLRHRASWPTSVYCVVVCGVDGGGGQGARSSQTTRPLSVASSPNISSLDLGRGEGARRTTHSSGERGVTRRRPTTAQ